MHTCADRDITHAYSIIHTATMLGLQEREATTKRGVTVKLVNNILAYNIICKQNPTNHFPIHIVLARDWGMTGLKQFHNKDINIHTA